MKKQGPTPKPLMERLLARSRREGACLISTYTTDRYGYAQVYFEGRSRRVHSLSYEKFVGKVPDGHVVRHSCNRRNCWEFTHLSTGTQADNIADREAFGVSVRGVGNGRAKINDDIVRQIRIEHATGTWTYSALGRKYGLTYVQIRTIVKRRGWKHVA